MSLRKFVLDPEKQKKFEENKKKNKKAVDLAFEKNRCIPKADIDMLVLDKYEKDFED